MVIISEKHQKFEILDKRKKERLDLFLTNSIENATRSKVQKLIKEGYVKVNDRLSKPSYILNPNDIIDVVIPITPRPDVAEPEKIELNIVFEDEYLIVVNKPAGMVVHPAYSNYTGTLVNALLYHTSNLSKIQGEGRAGIVHRLDKDTSGLLVVAKNEFVHSQLSKQFSKHSIDREYWAIVWGNFKEKSGLIEANLGRASNDRKKFAVVKEGKYAATFFEVLEEFEFMTLVKLNLKTGRTHQIRVHLASINHPVFGDPIYGGRRPHNVQLTSSIKQRINNLLEIMKRQALHAKLIGFIHPITKQHIKFDSELPTDIKNILERLR